MKNKTFVLDTNVLLFDPECIVKFGGHNILIPLTVLEEIDNHKKGQSALARAARQVGRNIDEIRASGPLHEWCPLPCGGKLKVILDTPSVTFSRGVNPDYNDNVIIQTIIDYIERESEPDEQVILVTKDTLMRCKADALMIPSEDYENSMIQDDNIYGETATHFVSDDVISHLHTGERLEDYDGIMYVNEYAVFKSNMGAPASALVRKYSDGTIGKIRQYEDVYNIKARNKEQHFAMDALMDPSIHLVVLAGQAGTGKTLQALAAGLEQVLGRDERYAKVLVSRPVVPMGRDIGFTPGTVQEKLEPWLSPIYDNYSFLSRDSHPSMRGRKGWAHLEDMGHVEAQALTYIRGRNIPNEFVLVDEVQNNSPLEVKTIVTRAGKGTKIVLAGDPYQIDHPYLDQYSNGLSYVIDRMKGSPIFAHVSLHRGERSELAEEAASRL